MKRVENEECLDPDSKNVDSGGLIVGQLSPHYFLFK